MVMADHVGYLLVRLGKKAQRSFETAIEPLGLRPPHFDLMCVLNDHENAAQHEVAEILAVDGARIAKLADELVTRDLVIRRANPSDRRRNELMLTRKGRTTLAQALELAAQVEAELAGVLSDSQIATLRRSLKKIAGLN